MGKDWQDRYAKEGHQASEIIGNHSYYSRRTQRAVSGRDGQVVYGRMPDAVCIMPEEPRIQNWNVNMA